MSAKSTKPSRGKSLRQKRDPLFVQIKASDNPGLLSRKRIHLTDDEIVPDIENEGLIDVKTTKKILQASREQMMEVEQSNQTLDPSFDASAQAMARMRKIESMRTEYDQVSDEDLDAGDDDLYEIDTSNLTKEEEEMLNKYIVTDTSAKKCLADVIMTRIQEIDEEKDVAPELQGKFPSKVLEVYSSVATHLSRFRSGKLPKAFKIIPNLKNWEDVLFLTRPDQWSPQATSAATKVFAANLSSKLAQRFYNLVLLPKVREDIEARKNLNYHLYLALKRSIFKPAAFFKGILLPLAAEDCTGRESVILCSILKKVSIPVVHSGVCLIKLCELPFSVPTTLMIKTLVQKKYALPRTVLDVVIDYFASAVHSEQEYPVIWHQALLGLVQKYKGSMSLEQKDRIEALIRKKGHHMIAHEVRRELRASTVLIDVPMRS